MPHYCEVTVRLLDTTHSLWRKFLLRDIATFEDLNFAIQDACGWDNCHLHDFSFGRNEPRIGMPDDQGTFDDDTRDESRIKLSSIFSSGRTKKCVYTYDFGDTWRHELKARRIELADDFIARLVDGEGAFPPEDCGGPWAFDELLVLAKKRAKELTADERERVLWFKDSVRKQGFDLAKAKAEFDIEVVPVRKRRTRS